MEGTSCRARLSNFPAACDGADMPKTAAKDRGRRTTMVPVTTMEELPVLSAKEPAELRASLEQAERRIKAGQGIDYDSKTFKQRLMGIYRGVGPEDGEG